MNNLLRALLIIGAGLWLTGCKAGRDAFAVTTTDTIITFQTDDANKIDNEATITGLDSGETLQQIDFRPANGLLYGLTSTARLVTVSPETGAAVHVGNDPISALPLTGAIIDVNPQNDYLRVIATRPTADGLGTETFNARINLDTGALISADSTTLRFVDNDLNDGELPELVAIAHSSNRTDATLTTEYGLDFTTQTLVRITTTGVLTTIGTVDTGFTANAGFDIVSERGDNNNDTGIAYVALADGDGSARLYEFDLEDGSTSNGDSIGDSLQIRSLAVTLRAPSRSGFEL